MLLAKAQSRSPLSRGMVRECKVGPVTNGVLWLALPASGEWGGRARPAKRLRICRCDAPSPAYVSSPQRCRGCGRRGRAVPPAACAAGTRGRKTLCFTSLRLGAYLFPSLRPFWLKQRSYHLTLYWYETRILNTY